MADQDTKAAPSAAAPDYAPERYTNRLQDEDYEKFHARYRAAIDPLWQQKIAAPFHPSAYETMKGIGPKSPQEFLRETVNDFIDRFPTGRDTLLDPDINGRFLSVGLLETAQAHLPPAELRQMKDDVAALRDKRGITAANCYAYAVRDRTAGDYVENSSGGEPGVSQGYDPSKGINYDAPHDKLFNALTKGVIAGVEKDGAHFAGRNMPDAKPGVYRMAYLQLVDESKRGTDGFTDFHFVAEDKQGWSHKPGETAVTRLDHAGHKITDPEKADWGKYQLVGYFEVPEGGLALKANVIHMADVPEPAFDMFAAAAAERKNYRPLRLPFDAGAATHGASPAAAAQGRADDVRQDSAQKIWQADGAAPATRAKLPALGF